MNYSVGDIVKLKKTHSCGENEWKILRVGVDIKLECLACNRQIWLKRLEFNKRVRKILNSDGKYVSIQNYNIEKTQN